MSETGFNIFRSQFLHARGWIRRQKNCRPLWLHVNGAVAYGMDHAVRVEQSRLRARNDFLLTVPTPFIPMVRTYSP